MDLTKNKLIETYKNLRSLTDAFIPELRHLCEIEEIDFGKRLLVLLLEIRVTIDKAEAGGNE